MSLRPIARFCRVLPLTAAAVLMLLTIGTAVAQKTTEVYVVGTLYKRHEQVPAFGLDVLRRVISDIKPEVLVLDVTPNELKDQTVHPSKIEYPQVIFPFAAQGGYPTYAAEPDEPLFTEIQKNIGEILERANAQRPTQRETLDAYSKATFDALKLHWTSPAAVQDGVTAAALSARGELSNTLTPGMKKISADWDRHTADVAIRAAKEHPGKRVLVLTGIQNRPLVVEYLSKSPNLKVVDIEAWLRANGYGG